MSKMTFDPAKVLQRLLDGSPLEVALANVAIRDVLLADAHARIAALEQPAEDVSAD